MSNTPQYFGMADAAARVGITRNALKKRWIKGQSPQPDAMYNDHRPLWLADTLDRFEAEREKREKEIQHYVNSIRQDRTL